MAEGGSYVIDPETGKRVKVAGTGPASPPPEHPPAAEDPPARPRVKEKR